MNIYGKRIHFIGIGGISLSCLAKISLSKGAIVSGSDISINEETKTLESLGVKIFYKHEEGNVLGVDIVVYSSAIKEDNVELQKAQKLGLTILKRAEFLAKIAGEYKTTIAISGSHGKTTTTAMVANLLILAGLNPTVHLGGEYSKIGGNTLIGGNDYFVTEACEYKDNFLYLSPQISVCLNVCADHLDYFKNLQNLRCSFKKFINLNKNGVVICNADDDFLANLNSNLTFSMENRGDVCAVNIYEYTAGKFAFDVICDGATLGNIKLNVYGKHNIFNALATICVGNALNIDFNIIKNSLEEFSGVDRRFQEVGEINGAKIIIDYAHHPDEIKSSIFSAKMIAKNKVIAVFQPHTYTRTQSFMGEFAKSLSLADRVGVYKIYPAREEKIEGVSNITLSNEVNKIKKISSYLNDYVELIAFINSKCKKGNVVLILGAGDYVSVVKELKFDQKA
ncbi:MAG: UDP-N-acetylmuramate--L-alanine ligase [Clostridia bacterium]|nr:UDP-N-acetylmuramate--L-alanine ligase [Clostridia bacterium]